MNLSQNAVAGCVPIRVAQVEEQCGNIHGALQDLLKMVDEIEQRLRSVTRNAEPMPEKTLQAPEEVLVPLAGNLRESWRSINSAVNRLRALNSAIELPYS